MFITALKWQKILCRRRTSSGASIRYSGDLNQTWASQVTDSSLVEAKLSLTTNANGLTNDPKLMSKSKDY